MPSENAQEYGLTTKRIESLTDGVFAIAMTLLVLNLELPPIGQGMTEVALHNLLFSQWYKFFNYALSFILLAVFWIIHHAQFHSIKRTNRVHLWINIIILLFVALIPFTTSLQGDFPLDSIAEFCFSANLFIIGSLFYLNWAYAAGKHRLVSKDLDERHIVVGGRRCLVVPLVSLLAMGLAFLFPGHSSKAYMLIPFILFLPPFKR